MQKCSGGLGRRSGVEWSGAEGIGCEKQQCTKRRRRIVFCSEGMAYRSRDECGESG